MMNSSELRQAFLSFFQQKLHTIVPTSSLVPADQTLLFTNAGMVQFKDVFLGREKRDYARAASSQMCVRAGGKHNDLENVGYTARHHTFFEMLGNFSFGDYFKREAITFAWEFLTQVLRLPQEKLWVTVYEEDDETADIWLKEMKVSPERFSRCGMKDNFWSMGDTGPCGPCTEIFYDHGPQIPGGPPGSPDADGDRYIEIWNLVFMQFNRDANGNLTPLPKPSVDTGMGLERISAVMQGVHDNYDIDIFRHLIHAVADLANTQDYHNRSLRVIADHIRSCAFLIADGVVPSNEGRGYVLRRILRRALRHGHKLNMPQPFFYKLVQPLIVQMGGAYPHLTQSQSLIEQVLLSEEQQFAKTLDTGMKIFEQQLTELPGFEIPGQLVFKLYDTFGFPADLTADIARERGYSIDEAGFEQEMEKQRGLSAASAKFKLDYGDLSIEHKSEFTGYELLKQDTKIISLLVDNKSVNNLNTKQEKAGVILNQTPFYAESGGQVGDKGYLQFNGGNFRVVDTQKLGDAIIHYGHLESGQLHIGDQVLAEVDQVARQATRLNHSATHLLHAALRQVLGTHVLQKGSLVEPARLRFDFSHFEALSGEQIYAIEELVNQQIRANHQVNTELMPAETAVKSGALALFGEKYNEEVRVLSMGEFSKELCGGTHVSYTGDIGIFKIISESGVAAGVRRIEAVTGEGAWQWVKNLEKQTQLAADLLRTKPESIAEKIQQLQQRAQILERQLEQLQAKMTGAVGNDLAGQATEVAGTKVLAVQVEQSIDDKLLRDMLDQLKNKLHSAVIVLGTAENENVRLLAGVTKDLTSRISAGELINAVAVQVGGKGGGRPDMAQAGGKHPANLPKALASVEDWVRQRLQS